MREPPELSKMRIVLWIALAAALGGCKREVDASFKTEPVSKGALSESVAATGEASAVVTVTVGSQISGTISRLYVDFNSPVRKGQLLAEIDPRLFEVAQARAAAGILAAPADEEKVEVVFLDAERSEQRLKELLAKGLVARAEVETATANPAGAAAPLRAAAARGGPGRGGLPLCAPRGRGWRRRRRTATAPRPTCRCARSAARSTASSSPATSTS